MKNEIIINTYCNMVFSTRLFVGNLPENLNEDDLRKAFSLYGEVTNLDIINKPGAENDKKVFAFITLSASNFNVESCIKHFSDQDFHGRKLYVTRARESFLERLQREREQTQKNSTNKDVPNDFVVTQKPIIEKVNNNFNKKRKFNDDDHITLDNNEEKLIKISTKHETSYPKTQLPNGNDKKIHDRIVPQDQDDKKINADRKRLESIKRKRQEFNEKKNIIKTGLISIDKQTNKKVIFSDTEEDNGHENRSVLHSHGSDQVDGKASNRKVNLFDDDESDDETNFDMKKHYEGKKGQKVLEMQSRYKADKRFALDERFVEDDENESDNEEENDHGAVDLEQVDEKSKQLHILQDVLGVSIKTRTFDVKDKTKLKPGMLRFDPSHPDHSKFLAPVEQKPESKKARKKKNKELQKEISEKPQLVVEKVEVSKEQFYKISDTLKEAITQPKVFSLRSLFANDKKNEEESTEQTADFIPLENKKDKKMRNPLDPGERNPFVYDSSDSENEDNVKNVKKTPELTIAEPKVVWREKLFFTENDNRLEDGLLFFSKKSETEATKDRRELKSLMKKRIYNKERKNHMFQKKIGGRKKTMKKSFRKKS